MHSTDGNEQNLTLGTAELHLMEKAKAAKRYNRKKQDKGKGKVQKVNKVRTKLRFDEDEEFEW